MPSPSSWIREDLCLLLRAGLISISITRSVSPLPAAEELDAAEAEKFIQGGELLALNSESVFPAAYRVMHS